ncbi:MAG: GNAT family N-acetyltransferase [Calditrichia bacterium]
MVLTGDITVLRPLAITDAALTFRWRQSQRAKFLQRGAKTVEAQEQWIATAVQSRDLNFIMEFRDEPVGMIALQEMNHLHKNAVLGRLLIGEPEKVGNAPVAFEAELLLLDHLFLDLDFHKLYGEIAEDNIAMIKTRDFLGYHRDGLLRDHYNFDGTFKNAVAVSLLKNEYVQTTRKKLVDLIRLLGRMG